MCIRDREYGRYAFSNENVNSVCGLVPGVMAQTGMECLETVSYTHLQTGNCRDR